MSISGQTFGSVLVVDDEQPVLKLVCSILERSGYHCDAYLKASEALAAVDAVVKEQEPAGWSPWDVLILDVNLRDVEGFSLLEKIRAREGFATVPALFMSGIRLEREDIERGLALGALDYLAKPFRPAILRAKVHNFAELGRFRREAHRTALALEESEAWHRELFAGSSQGIIVMDESFQIMRCNHAAGRLLQSKPEDLRGKDWAAVFAKTQGPGSGAEAIETLRQTRKLQQSVCTLRKADGSTFEAELRVDFVPLMGQPSYAAFIEDVTARVEAEQKIAELADFRENLIENANVWIDTTDLEGNVLTWNRAAEQISGYVAADVIGHGRIWEWLYPDRQYREQMLGRIRAALDGDTVSDLETTIQPSDGPSRVIAWTASRLLGVNNQPIGLISVGQDVTIRRYMEEELRRHAERLEEMVAERTQTIHRLERDRAQAEKFAAQGQVAAGIAHEINNPLATIQNFLSVVRENRLPDSERVRYFDVIGKEIERIARIVGQMYDLYQPGAQEATLVAVNEIVGGLLQTLEPKLIQRRIRIVDRRSDGPVRIVAPHGHLTQILFNVIRNAVDAVQSGGEIEILTTQHDDLAIIDVADTGSGIRPDDLPRIFDPFFTTRRGRGRESGLGLGLAVTRSLVETLRGEIAVAETSAKGTRMRITLPVA